MNPWLTALIWTYVIGALATAAVMIHQRPWAITPRPDRFTYTPIGSTLAITLNSAAWPLLLITNTKQRRRRHPANRP